MFDDPQDEQLDDSIDPMLESLVNLAELGPGMPITLTVHGIIVTGELIGIMDYSKAQAEQVSRGAAETNQAYAAGLRKAIDKHEGLETYSPDGKPAYVHLRNAYYISGGRLMPDEPFIWRGRIDAIDGWSFGRLQQVQDEE